MPNRQPFRRVLVKLSGEAFCSAEGFGVEATEIGDIAREILAAHQTGAQLAIVVGGGNIIRGAELAAAGVVHKATADYMGMLATVMNGVALKEALEEAGLEARCMTALDIPAVAEPFIRLRALRHMELGRVVVLAGGTGNPYFTTDTCAALRATELECQAVLKATKVDGVYTADPKADPGAERFEELTFAECLERQLRVMDQTALAMCREQRIPIVVFDYGVKNNIKRVVEGERVGTIIQGP